MADQRTAPLNAIETTYAGHLFRSRLEARWAVFFDALGIAWEYEPQGYLVGFHEERPYLPDFYLPGVDIWVEVKGSDRAVDWSLLGDAVDGIGGHHLPMGRPYYEDPERRVPGSHGHYGTCGGGGAALIVLGNIPPESRSHYPWGHTTLVNQKGVMAGLHAWTGGPAEHALLHLGHLGYYDSSSGGPVYVNEGCDLSVHGERIPYRDCAHPRVEAAYAKARKARFEHGANGR